ncbi:MAG: hypothetical protein IT422_26460 [Pirellulaceae bacterium]|jgi:hypothetical protein|nr:hypothetical protein [Pirellulaceae bacterium]
MKIEPYDRFSMVLQLLEIAERAFVYKLRKRRPAITEQEIEVAIKDWYALRPGASLGDGLGVPGDRRRFQR